jgi:uncharacterized Zn-binding protein involved in type VI secretion
MGQPAAKQGDQITATDTHVVMVPDGPNLVPKPLPHTFSGPLSDELSPDVRILGKPAAVVGSTATNTPQHVPTPPGTSFQKSPSNKGTIQAGSQTVSINGKFAARHSDTAVTCNDPVDSPVGSVVVNPGGTVNIG